MRLKKEQKNRFFFLATILATSLFLIQCGSKEIPDKDLNVIVIVSDSLRADSLGFAGYSRDTSPFLDSIAKDSVIFQDAVSVSSFTRESVATIFQGVLPSRSGSMGWRASPSSEFPTMAQIFQQNGYRTGFFVVTPVLWGEGFSRGFEEVDSLSSTWNQSRNSGILTERALQFVKDLDGQKFKMYLHYLDPHGPYDPPEDIRYRFAQNKETEPIALYGQVRNLCDQLIKEGFGPGEARFEDLVSRYDAEILDVDRAIEDLFAGLSKLGVLDHTLVVFTSDHGEEFLEHNFVEHAWTLYEESIRIPLLFWSPNLFEPAVVKGRVSLLDVLPTVLDLADLPAGDLSLDGTSLVAIEDDSIEFRVHSKPVFAELLLDNRNVIRALVKDDWKYISTLKWISPAERSALLRAGHNFLKLDPSFDFWTDPIQEELYDLSTDPEESINLADKEKEKLERFRSVMNNYLQSTSEKRLSDTRSLEDLSEEELEKIRQLGYIQ